MMILLLFKYIPGFKLYGYIITSGKVVYILFDLDTYTAFPFKKHARILYKNVKIKANNLSLPAISFSKLFHLIGNIMGWL
jgi:hypothetical protein